MNARSVKVGMRVTVPGGCRGWYGEPPNRDLVYDTGPSTKRCPGTVIGRRISLSKDAVRFRVQLDPPGRGVMDLLRASELEPLNDAVVEADGSGRRYPEEY